MLSKPEYIVELADQCTLCLLSLLFPYITVIVTLLNMARVPDRDITRQIGRGTLSDPLVCLNTFLL
jgi:hypothetical protein